MKRKELRVNTSGLMRCCLASLDEWVATDPTAEVKDGDTVQCKYERDGYPRMIVDAGAVRWHRSTHGLPDDPGLSLAMALHDTRVAKHNAKVREHNQKLFRYEMLSERDEEEFRRRSKRLPQ